MFVHVAACIVSEREHLTRADQAIGDGDHGVAMARGFAAARGMLESNSYSTVGELFQAVGNAILSHAGGASGVIFGTLFRAAAGALRECRDFDGQALEFWLRDGLAAVQKRGGAQSGDKSVVDALAPAAEAAAVHSAASLAVTLEAVAGAASQGAESTRQMVARVGKARALGERSLGHPDPGAITLALILRAMSEYAPQLS
jgi:dihydroxyacetone kinase-like protein